MKIEIHTGEPMSPFVQGTLALLLSLTPEQYADLGIAATVVVNELVEYPDGRVQLDSFTHHRNVTIGGNAGGHELNVVAMTRRRIQP
jgi:hypothetical protein